MARHLTTIQERYRSKSELFSFFERGFLVLSSSTKAEIVAPTLRSRYGSGRDRRRPIRVARVLRLGRFNCLHSRNGDQRATFISRRLEHVRALALQDKVCRAWVNFTRTGHRPDQASRLSPYTVARKETMVFHTSSRHIQDDNLLSPCRHQRSGSEAQPPYPDVLARTQTQMQSGAPTCRLA